MIKLDIITEFSEFQKLQSIWKSLLENQPSQDIIFLRYEWFECCWQSLSRKSRLYVMLAYENNRIIGIAPLMIRKSSARGLPIRLLSFVTNGNSAHNDIIIREKRREVIELFFDYLARTKPEWDLLELGRIPLDSPNLEILRELFHSKGILFVEEESICSPYLTINRDWQSYINELSQKTKKTTRNIKNRFKKEGNYSIEKIIDYDRFKEIRNQLFDIEKNSWKETRGNSLNRLPNREFFDRLSYISANNGWLLIWILYLNNLPIAFEYHLDYKGKVHALRCSYNKDFHKLSPGTFLNYLIIKHFFVEGKVNEYDMGGSTELYKLRWTSDCRRHKTFQIFTNKPYSRLIFMYEYKSIPLLRHLIRRS